MEEWKDIEGYEGLYQVSNFGNVRSLDRYIKMKNKWGGVSTVLKKGKKLKKWKYPNGYLFFPLHKNNICKQFLAHRLVANAFIINPDNLPVVNHKDENKENNTVENLEWCNHPYNNTYNDRHIKVGKKLHNRKDLSKIVYKYTLDDELVETYPSASEAARQNGVNVARIIQCCNGGYFCKTVNKWCNLTVKGHRYSYEHP